MIKIAVLLAVVAYVCADVAKQAPGPNEVATRNILAEKQHHVNLQALHRGAGVGTAPYDGVPGTDKHGYGYYGHGYGYQGGYPYYGGYGGYYGHGYGHPYGYAGPYYGGAYYGGYPYFGY